MKNQIFIFPTFLCNLNCPRCYQKKLDIPKDYMMSFIDFQRILKRVSELKLKETHWVFTGGEPTLWPELKRALLTVKQVRPNVKIRVVTNGFRREIGDYGCADVIQVSDYGALNRLDYYNLKKADGKRVKIQTSVHWDWDREQTGEPPKRCGCKGLSFVGTRVWPCAMAAACQSIGYMDIDQDFSKLTGVALYQKLCLSCLVNNRKVPKPVFQFSAWEGKGWIL